MSSVVQDILENVIGDGARSSKFDCIINFNNTGLFTAEKDIYALVKTSQFPGKAHEVIDLKYKGRSIPIKGQVKYDNTWSCTFYLTHDHALKTAFENWIESLDQVHNIKEVSSAVVQAQRQNLDNYAGIMNIAQMDFHGSQECVLYTLYHCFPKSVSAVDVDYSDVGKISEFTVEFSYAYFDTYSTKLATGNFVDDLVNKAKAGFNDISGLIKSTMSGLIKDSKEVISGILSFADPNSSNGLSKLSGFINSGYSSGSSKVDLNAALSKGISRGSMAKGFYKDI